MSRFSKAISELEVTLKNQQEAAKDMDGEALAAQEDLIAGTEKQIKQQQELLANAVKGELPTRLAIFRAMQKEELTQKGTLKLVKERIKGNKTVTKEQQQFLF